MSFHTIIQKYFNIIKQNIALMQHLYEPKPISCCHNYIISLNSHFRNPKQPTSLSVIQNWKMPRCLPALSWQQQLVTALES